MKKAILIATALISNLAFAGGQATGQSTLKLDNKSDDSIRITRKAIEGLDKEIAALDQKIVETRLTGTLLNATPAANPMTGGAFTAQANALELERADLTARRNSLQTDLQYQSN
jgi:hypothetical protein